MGLFSRRKKNKRTVEDQNKHNEEIWKTDGFTRDFKLERGISSDTDDYVSKYETDPERDEYLKEKIAKQNKANQEYWTKNDD